MASARRMWLAVVMLAAAILAMGNAFGQNWTDSRRLDTTDTGDDGEPHLATDGAGTWIAVWTSTDSLGGTISTDHDILFSRSTDHGQTWSASAALNTNAGTDTGGDYRPRIAHDGAGNWLVVWSSSENLGGTIGTDYDIFFSISADAGQTWSAPAPLNTNAGSDSGTDNLPWPIALGAGSWHVVWESNEDLGGIGTDYDIFFSHSEDNGSTWSAPAPLNHNAAIDTGYDYAPRTAADGAGNLVAVWYSNENIGGLIGTDGDIFSAVSADYGQTWSATVLLNTNAATDAGDDQNPAIVFVPGSGWVAAWESNDPLGGTIGIDYDILFARSVDGAVWSAPAPLNANAGGDEIGNIDRNVDLDEDGLGNLVAAWGSNVDLGGVLGTDFDIFFSFSRDGGATWSFPAALDPGATDDDNDWDDEPVVKSDGNGRWVAGWRHLGSIPGHQVLYSSDQWHLVAFRTDGVAGATVNGEEAITQTVPHLADCDPVTAAALAGMSFLYWTGDQVGFDNPLTITSVTGDLAVTATFGKDLAAGLVFEAGAADVFGLPAPGNLFRVKPKVWGVYTDPVKEAPGKKATAKVLTAIDKTDGSASVACEWKKKIKLYLAKTFKEAQKVGTGAAEWLNAEGNQEPLPVDLRLVSKEAADQPVYAGLLRPPEILTVTAGVDPVSGDNLYTIEGNWFGTKKPKVWREYTPDGLVEVKRQAMKLAKPTEADAALGFRDGKGKPAYMNRDTGASKAVVVVPAAPRGTLAKSIVLDNGVGLAADDEP